MPDTFQGTRFREIYPVSKDGATRMHLQRNVCLRLSETHIFHRKLSKLRTNIIPAWIAITVPFRSHSEAQVSAIVDNYRLVDQDRKWQTISLLNVRETYHFLPFNNDTWPTAAILDLKVNIRQLIKTSPLMALLHFSIGPGACKQTSKNLKSCSTLLLLFLCI